MSGHGRGRSRGGGHEEEHENHERWAVSYADMMTVLMALFLVLYAMSTVDSAKYEQLRGSLAAGFGNDVLESGGSILADAGNTPNPVEVVTSSDGDPSSSPVDPGAIPQDSPGEASSSAAGPDIETAARQEAARLEAIRDEIAAALAAQGLADRVDMTITKRGLKVTLVADEVFFESASATIRPVGQSVVDTVAPVLSVLTEDVAVEGHANHLALNPRAAYPTNWELSAARATAVLRRLVAGDVAGERLAAVGLGDTHPLYPESDPRAIDGNRRVDVVVLSDKPADVRELVPGFAGTPPGEAE